MKILVNIRKGGKILYGKHENMPRDDSNTLNEYEYL